MRRLIVVVVALVAGFSAMPVGAALVTVNNPGFETGNLTGWTSGGGSNGVVAYNNAGVQAAAPGFSGYGTYFGYVGYGDVGIIRQTLNGTGNEEIIITAGEIYTLSVQVGRPNNWSNEFGWKIGLESSDGTPLASAAYDGSTRIPERSWELKQVSYTVLPGDPKIGQYLVIALSHFDINPDPGVPGSGVYDQVELDLVPEPATCTLLVVGGLGILLNRRRIR